MTITLEATVVRLLIGLHPLIALAEKQASPDGHYLTSTRVSAVRATLEGLEGDRHAGFTRRADARVPNLSRLPPMTRVYFPELAALALEGENHPCVYPGKAIQHAYPEMPGLGKRFPKAAYHLRGVVGWVERAGMIRAGDTVRIDVPEYALYPAPEMEAR